MSNDTTDGALYYGGLRKKLANQVFLKNLALMHDALEELSHLSDALQKGGVTLTKANRKIQREIEIFRSRKEHPGSFYMEAIAAIDDGQFQGVALSNAGKQEREVNCKQFYQGLVDSMTARLMSADDKKFVDLVSITQADIYQDQFAPDHGERELRELLLDLVSLFPSQKMLFVSSKKVKALSLRQNFRNYCSPLTQYTHPMYTNNVT